MLETLLKKFKGYNKTCPVNNLEDKCISFIKSDKFFECIKDSNKDVWVIVPDHFPRNLNISKNIKLYYTKDPKYIFILIHNEIYKDFIPDLPIIGKGCKIHKNAVIGVDGVWLSRSSENKWAQLIHTGNVVIEDNVDIGPFTVIHKGTLKDTIIKNGVKMGSNNSIGHNNIIGKNTVFTVGVITGGSVIIDDNCMLGMGAIIKNGVKICKNTTIGMGAVVTKDIKESGTYVGNPARIINKKQIIL